MEVDLKDNGTDVINKTLDLRKRIAAFDAVCRLLPHFQFNFKFSPTDTLFIVEPPPKPNTSLLVESISAFDELMKIYGDRLVLFIENTPEGFALGEIAQILNFTGPVFFHTPTEGKLTFKDAFPKLKLIEISSPLSLEGILDTHYKKDIFLVFSGALPRFIASDKLSVIYFDDEVLLTGLFLESNCIQGIPNFFISSTQIIQSILLLPSISRSLLKTYSNVSKNQLICDSSELLVEAGFTYKSEYYGVSGSRIQNFVCPSLSGPIDRRKWLKYSLSFSLFSAASLATASYFKFPFRKGGKDILFFPASKGDPK